MCFVSLNRHSHAQPYSYHSELWADKAGYNVYLPSVFIYHNVSFPDSLAAKTGYGFEIDSLSHKVITKYPYGVALLQSPFWLLAHALSTDKTGYSIYYQRSVDFAGCFYLTLGLFFLFFTIREFRSKSLTILLLATIAFSSGIFYYGIFETGMSHVYSFCCLSVILFLFFKNTGHSSFIKFLWLGILSAVFVMIRPVNILFLAPALLFLLYYSKHLNFASLKTVTLGQFVAIGLACFIIVFPQLLYYKYAFGSFLSNSYHKEPFFFPSLNRTITLLCSPHNGLLTYYPVIIALLIFSFYTKSVYSKLTVPLLIIYIILYASWWSLSLGCGFGHRAINDIIILLFLPVCFSNVKIPKLFYVLFLLFIVINIKFMFSYDGCLYKSDNWSYSEYFSILFGEFK